MGTAQPFERPSRCRRAAPAFAGLDARVLNVYGTPSIHNELTWALDPARPFQPEQHILEVTPGKYADIHLGSVVPPGPRDEVLARRAAILHTTRQVTTCHLVILTLGFAEVWFDSTSRCYLNETPRIGLIRAYPDRFHLHVLSFDEAHRYLDDAIRLLRRVGSKDLQVLLTVSPVPMQATHRPLDVMVANSYSKSLLRAAAEAVCLKHERVTYYPAYESVMLSDRAQAWQDDLRHVQEPVVSLNVHRLVGALLGTARDLDAVEAEVGSGGAAVAVAYARQFGLASDDAAAAFFDRFAPAFDTEPGFAQEHVRFLMGRGDCAAALALLDTIAPAAGSTAILLLKAMCARRLGQPLRAVACLAPHAKRKVSSPAFWQTLVASYYEAGDRPGAIAAVHSWLWAMPRLEWSVCAYWASLVQAHDPEHAVALYRKALAIRPDAARIQFELAELLLRLNRPQEAWEVVRDVFCDDPRAQFRLERIRVVAGAAQSVSLGSAPVRELRRDPPVGPPQSGSVP